MWQDKLKAITFSFDDGVKQDKTLIALLNKYHIKATFNLNSAGFGSKNVYMYQDIKPIIRDRFEEKEIKSIYQGHEVASHTLNHKNLVTLTESEIIKEVEEDRQKLSEIVGYEVVGFAYPCGGVNYNEHVADIIKKHTGVKYCRTTISSYCFDLPDNLYCFHPTVYFREYNKAIELAKEFINLKPSSPKCFYIWCHAYEFDYEDDSWNKFEEFLKLIAFRDDVFYGTNKEVLLKMEK